MTVEEDRCICCDLPLYSCGKYVEEQAAAAKRAGVRHHSGKEREAEYGGICVGCNTHFPAGALIEWDADEAGWRSVECCP